MSLGVSRVVRQDWMCQHGLRSQLFESFKTCEPDQDGGRRALSALCTVLVMQGMSSALCMTKAYQGHSIRLGTMYDASNREDQTSAFCCLSCMAFSLSSLSLSVSLSLFVSLSLSLSPSLPPSLPPSRHEKTTCIPCRLICDGRPVAMLMLSVALPAAQRILRWSRRLAYTMMIRGPSVSAIARRGQPRSRQRAGLGALPSSLQCAKLTA